MCAVVRMCVHACVCVHARVCLGVCLCGRARLYKCMCVTLHSKHVRACV